MDMRDRAQRLSVMIDPIRARANGYATKEMEKVRCPVCDVLAWPNNQKWVCPSCHAIVEGCCS